MKKGDDLQPNQPARVLAGMFKGLTGTCVSVDREKGIAVLDVSGLWNGEKLDGVMTFKLGNLGRPANG